MPCAVFVVADPCFAEEGDDVVVRETVSGELFEHGVHAAAGIAVVDEPEEVVVDERFIQVGGGFGSHLVEDIRQLAGIVFAEHRLATGDVDADAFKCFQERWIEIEFGVFGNVFPNPFFVSAKSFRKNAFVIDDGMRPAAEESDTESVVRRGLEDGLPELAVAGDVRFSRLVHQRLKGVLPGGITDFMRVRIEEVIDLLISWIVNTSATNWIKLRALVRQQRRICVLRAKGIRRALKIGAVGMFEEACQIGFANGVEEFVDVHDSLLDGGDDFLQKRFRGNVFRFRAEVRDDTVAEDGHGQCADVLAGDIAAAVQQRTCLSCKD